MRDDLAGGSGPPTTTVPVVVGLSPSQVFLWLALVTLALTLGDAATIPASVAAAQGDTPPGYLPRLFMLDDERSIGTWFSSMLLALNMGLLVLNGRAARAAGTGLWPYWLALALVFAFLSMDEIITFHEKLGTALHRRFDTDGILRFAWVLPGGLFAASVGLGSIRFLRRLPRRTAALFLIAGATYVGGALLVEMIEAVVASGDGRGVVFYLLVLVEEPMEMLGQTIFASALVDHLAQGRTRMVFAP
jgi:hypothetical protein